MTVSKTDFLICMSDDIRRMGVNAVVSCRIETCAIMHRVSEIIVCGTAVRLS
ncbi:heavy metal-binding domain-containing protein [Yoonia sp.]|uniref:heavy metal-binding domain-containing protein n=1 Tax=Yoonia sp. TaxID=2212373 RepID=UPI001A0B6450|nr:heavy metal-binding domain-containing protein [Yoonia sp.]MBE0413943.1 heavy metal-binding domain-containing protein [Yoonia sp.]